MKKKIPLELLKSLQPHADKNLNLIEVIRDEKSIFRLEDKDTESDFYFTVKQISPDDSNNFLIEFKPKNIRDVSSSTQWATLNTTLNIFKSWIEIIKDYNQIHTIYDDPILKQYEQSFNDEFDIIDEDAYTHPFRLSQQLFLDEYLEKAKEIIEKHKQGKDEKELLYLDNLSKEATFIQENLTKESKKETISKLSKFWAKAQKFSIKLIRELFADVSTQLTKELIKGAFLT